MIKVVVIKFKSGGKLYYFAPKAGEEYLRDMPVIVETAKGLEYAWVAYPEKEVDESERTKSFTRLVRRKSRRRWRSARKKSANLIWK